MSELKEFMTGIDLRNSVKAEVKRKVKQKFVIHKCIRRGVYTESYTSDITDVLVEMIIEEYQKSIIDALKKGMVVKIRNFMSFYTRISEQRRVRNPKTNEYFVIAPRRRLRVRPCKELEDYLAKQK